MNICIIAEKPSVARDIARIVGANQKQDGFLSGNGYTVTWAFGHLVTLAMPTEYGFEKYNADDLPILPHPFKLTVRQIRKGKEYTADPAALKQLKIIRTCFDQCERIIVATDAGREGELIFRYIFDYLQCQKTFDRLWISSLTDKAIREGLENLKNGSVYDNLYLSGKARSEADWLVGINASRALSLAARKGGYSLGRVQTPTLAMVCKRFLENKNFQSVPYWQIKLTLEKAGIRSQAVSETKFEDNATARSVCAAHFAGETGSLAVSKVERKAVDTEPPLLFDLTSLQKEANRKYGFSADKTLSIAQSLYEKKCITYPRTGSRYIGEDIFEEIPSLIENLHLHPVFGTYARMLSVKTLNKRCVDASKVTDHHALLITENKAEGLTANEQTIYNRIASRMLETFSDKSVQEVQHVEFTAGEHLFKTKNTRLLVSGWRSVLNEKPETEDDETEQTEFPDFTQGETVAVQSHKITQHQTKPKPLYNEATLLSAMETAGKDLADEETKAAMKACGLGTPATRANIIETLIVRDYIVREKKTLVPTEKGLAVYQIVKERKIADAEMTGSWEKALADIENGKMNAETFHQGIEVYTRQICQDLLNTTECIDRYKTYPCPVCKNQSVRVYPKIAKCVEPECDFKIFRELCGTLLSKDNIHSLMTNGTTPLLYGLVGKSGKKFNARLVLNADHTTSFAFEPNKKNNSKPNQKQP
ncbi:MAG: type IA DNA topoisomerase [Bacteroidia bacterium]|nr:type IA DNA topoisomerase [Bacteroidia bacterium]